MHMNMRCDLQPELQRNSVGLVDGHPTIDHDLAVMNIVNVTTLARGSMWLCMPKATGRASHARETLLNVSSGYAQ